MRPQGAGSPGEAAGDWASSSIFYGLDVARFADGNGDGIGDFIGLRQRLDYLRRLRVTCLWLSPFYETPDHDNGYDVRDHRAIDPRLGTLRDFDAFLKAAHRKGMRVIVDLVANHTSIEHPWFDASRDPRSPYHDYYHWAPRPPPTHARPRSVFPTIESSVWTRDRRAGAWYFHRHYRVMPDLNLGSERVQEEIADIIRFWAKRGVDGFRVDSLTVLFDKKSRHPAPEPRKLLRRWRAALSEVNEHAVLLGEADVVPEDYHAHFGHVGGHVDLLLNFYLCSSLFLALATKRQAPIHRALRRQGARPRHGQWANFLRNLDELDLEQLTAKERRRVLSAFAPKPSMRAYDRGARRRLAPMMRAQDRLRLAWTLLFAMPGAPLFVYGDELAMGEDLRRKERHAVRLPMPWQPDVAPGSMICWQERSPRPRPRSLQASLRRINVASQEDDKASFLHWFRSLVLARSRLPEVASAPYRVVSAGAGRVFAIRYAGRKPLLALHNLSRRSQRAQLPNKGPWRRLWGSGPQARVDGRVVALPPHGYLWLRRG